MLQIKNIKKKYQTGDYIQTALDDVSTSLRDSEFVAILGPSGSGKTTLLNIIGGLDRYDDGDLIINNISTKKYKDKDWDSYRNHTIGFVFQSYNLIGHQSVLTNVELALTISGISKSERKKRAILALKEVGLGDHINKKPNQMSGGQMQRVAIARALVNNPDILLADEPTGALDSETSVQIMELLKEVAKDRLVVMVTHNPELAYEYATRIINFKDGKIVDDSDEFNPDSVSETAVHKNMGKASMSFLTALSLSFNNLKTKKGRTILTAFAGSIGIIGVSLILALSSGVNQYIEDIQKETMSSYPITIESSTFDFESMMNAESAKIMKKDDNIDTSRLYADNSYLLAQESMKSSIIENNLTNFKLYLDDTTSEIHEYLGENGIIYSYDVKFDVFATDADGNVRNTNDIHNDEMDMQANPMDTMFSMMGMTETTGASNFSELLANAENTGVSSIITDNYEVISGRLATEYNEVMLVVGLNNELSIERLYQLGFITDAEYNEIKNQASKGEELEALNWSFDDVLGHKFDIVTYSDYYVQANNGTFVQQNYENALENATEIEIVGVLKVYEDAVNATISTNIVYLPALRDYVIEKTDNSDVVLAQESDEEINVLTGVMFKALSDADKVSATTEFLSNMEVSEKASVYSLISGGAQDPSQFTSEVEMAMALDYWLASNPDESILISIYSDFLGESSLEDNLYSFGKISYDAPTAISIYTDTFEDKENISMAITNYNKTVDEDEEIVYTDYVALLTSSLTSIIDVVSYVLISFVSVSLVVSCIMIGIITHISVLERTKEIGILRAIGASKSNISQVFNAETLIIGLCAGLLGVGISGVLTLPINQIIRALTSNDMITVSLPIVSGAVLVVISTFITMIAGYSPAKSASKKDPVTALRTE